MPDVITFAACLTITAVAALVQGITGSGYAIISLPILSLFVNPKTLVPIMVIHGTFIGAVILMQSWRDVQMWRVWRLMVAGIIGIPLGAYLLKVMSVPALNIFTGAVITVFALALLIWGGWQVKRERAALLPVGFAAGILNGSLGMCGPPVILFLTNQNVGKSVFRSSVAPFFIILNLLSLPAFAMGGLLTQDVWNWTIWLFPAMVIGAGIGLLLHKHVNEILFRRIVLVMVLVAGVVAVAAGVR